MPDDPLPVSPSAARAALHRIIEQLTDDEVTGLWDLFCSWGAGLPRPSQTDTDRGAQTQALLERLLKP